ncbi:MAG: UDP-N-acetylmuramoyl-tripeptide--D-alanyl-D-alanine ligase [Clostridia bacterium]|nr:UDP-N-acetylmuramoyl-tripeptide--D-alanyl-D-alanine ligase [Clostridia bacterium]
MSEAIFRIIASVVSACLFCVSTRKLLGALQQSGYKNGTFWRYLMRKDNLAYNRLAVLSLCLALATAITSLSFSFLGIREGLVISSVPFFGLVFLYLWVDGKYALKVELKNTGRVKRLFVVYFIVTALFSFCALTWMDQIAAWNGSAVYASLSYVPFALLPAAMPLFLLIANGFASTFEEWRNASYVKRAARELEKQPDLIRIGVVGSYGKTSVKHILKTLLSEKYAVVETPESYNTPMGIAKTVFSDEFAQKQIFLAEMGARKAGDIEELCSLVQPDYTVFTGVCEQHIQTFGSLENVWKTKSEILRFGVKKAICGEALRPYIERDFEGSIGDSILLVGGVKNAEYRATETVFTLVYGEEEIEVKTALLGGGGVENITLAAALCKELGLTAEELKKGLEKLQPIPHRLQLIRSNGAYILDDGYNCNLVGAKEAIAALTRFGGGKCIVTPGIVECGILEEKLNGELGAAIAAANLDKVILVGETLVGAVKNGYESAGGDKERLTVVPTLGGAQKLLAEWVKEGDAVLFLNDLPDVY